MKNLYSDISIYIRIKSIVFILIVALGIGAHSAYGEGTKQLAPKSDDRVYTAFNDAKHGNFGNYDSQDAERIYFHIHDPENEQVFFGFSQFVNSGHTPANNLINNLPTWMRIKDPGGNVVWPNNGSPAGQMVQGSNTQTLSDDQISSLAQVKNGPNQICGTSGYDAIVFSPTSGSGDYYIEFSAAQSTNKKRPIYTEWWDITVATKGVTPQAIDGRVFAKQWSLVSPYISVEWYDRPFNGKVYSYAESASYSGGYVTEVDFENSGFRGARFSLAFNSKGTSNTPDFEVNRKSVEDENRLAQEFKIFLNEPDETVYPSAEGYGEFITGVGNEYPRLFGCEGKYFFRVAVTKKGRIDLLLDFHGSNNKYDPNTRDRIITTLSNPFPNEEGILLRDIQWDGLDGLGNPVSDVELNSLSCVFDYFLGTFHFPMYDVEYLTKGIVPRTVRPATPTSYTPKLYWDDSDITESLPGGQLKVDLTGEKAPSHYWLDYDYGNENSINTYWHSYSSGVITTLELEQTRDCALFEPGTISGTVFEDLNRNGLKDLGELSLEGAEVRLYWDKTYNKQIDVGDELIETFITKVPGSFGYPEGLGNFIFSPEIGKEYLVEVRFGSNLITGENPRSYTMYSLGAEYFDQFFGVAYLAEVSLMVSESIIQEDNQSSVITAELDYPTLLPVTITLAYGGTSNLTDYSLIPGVNATNSTTIEIPTGETSGSITLTSIGDDLFDGDETVEISIASLSNSVENGVQNKLITIIDGDHAITNLIDTDPADNLISENAVNNDLIHITALATDEDGDIITYHLLDDAGGRFKIDNSSGVVSVADASLIDFELNEFHMIRVEARSSDGSMIAADFTITITDVDSTGGDTDHAITNLIDNDPAENIISENAVNNDLVHITALATDEDGDIISYHLYDDAGGRFKIDNSSGVVSVSDASLIDFELNEFHVIRIEARSSDGSMIAADFTITITDVDSTEGDTDHAITNLIDNDPADNLISENAINNDLVRITALATDEDGDVITYHLLDDAGGRFKIDNLSGVVSVANDGLIDFESDKFHVIRIEARSSDASVIAADFTITITDVDSIEGDTDHAITNLIDNDPADNSISENAINNDLVHITALATDEDGDIITYHLLDDAGGRFKIDNSSGIVSVADASLIDFELNEFHAIRIEARSSDGSMIAADFTISISDVDSTEGDTDHAITNLIDIDPAENIINENAVNNDLVHITALATDEDGDVITYYLLDDAEGRFKIDNSTGVVSVGNESLIDFELDEFHIIRIEARSSDGSVIAEDFTISISDVDSTEGDTDHAITNLIDNDPADNLISENAVINDLVHITALATDEDGDKIGYILLDDAGGRFKIDKYTGVVSVKDAGLIDFEQNEFHIIRIEACSSDGSMIAADFTISISNADSIDGDTDHAIANLIDNDPADNLISENAVINDLVHITALATDEDGDIITYYLLDDAGGRFQIDNSSGVVSVEDAGLIDFEQNEFHIIRIEARSSDGSSIAEDFTISISDVDSTKGDTDHAITNLIDNDPADNLISENAINNDLVHITALAIDEDGDVITYYLLDDAGGRFKIDNSSGIVSIEDESLIDFELDEFHVIRIEARSSDGSSIAEDFTISISDVDSTEGDTDHAITNLIDNDPADNLISENAVINDLVHITALATDEDGDKIGYILLDDAGGRFKIDKYTGVVSVKDAGLIDFEQNEFHIIRIEACSSDGSMIAENFTILITDIGETLIANDDIGEVNEDEILNGESVLANDYKVPGTSLYIRKTPIVDVSNGHLVIHADGSYTYTPNPNFNGTDSFVYSVCDDGVPGQHVEALVSITVHSVNDAPIAVNDMAQVKEDHTLNGPNLLENDSDIDNDLLSINTSPIENVKHGDLSINSDGTYIYIPDADFNGGDSFIYEICDNETLEACGQATVMINVIPVNDSPIVFDFEMEVEEASLNNPINLKSPYDVDGDKLSVKILSTVEFGEIVRVGEGILSNNSILSIDDLLNLVFNARERYIGEQTMVYEVSDGSGLSAIGRVKINVVPIDVFIPNAITPNNDNFNDKFKIVGLEKFPENSLQIFNRWGNIVYKKHSYDNSWEGYGNVKGRISHNRLPPGTYYYVFKFGINKQPLSGYVYMTY